MVSRNLQADYVRTDGRPVSAPEFDFAILGSSMLVDGHLPEESAAMVLCPAMVILPSRELFTTFDSDMAAITLDGMDRLAFIVRRELRHDALTRRRIEEALDARETQLMFAQQLAATGAWEWDVATDVLRVTSGVRKLFTNGEPYVTLTEWLDVVLADDLESLRAAFRNTLENGTTFDLRYRIRGPNNGARYLHSRAERVVKNDGSIVVVGITQDVTEQTLAVQALRESESRYRNLVAQVPGIVWSTDGEGRLLFVSEKVTDLTGYTAAEFMEGGAKLWLDAITAADLQRVPEQWRAMLDGGSFETDFRFRRKDGESVWLHLRAARVDSSGAMTVVGVATDVTDRRIAEDALRASEARYRTLVEGATDVIVSIDGDGLVQSVNRATEELTGGSRVDWIGRSILEALSPSSAEQAKARFEAIRAGGSYNGYTEYELRTRSGRFVTMEAQVRPVEAHGEVVGIVIVARDITARREAEARGEKEKRLASLGQLATAVAHEFNNVLMSIMPFAELLQRRMPDDERVRTSTSHIMQAVRRGREISQEILRFARPMTPELAPVLAAGWMRDFAQKAASILGPRYAVSIEPPPDDVAFVADRALLDQIATNLTINAREAMPGGGSLQIAARAEKESVHISFVDTGAGIDPQLLDRIFEPLFTTKRDGNGLGLSIAHQAMVHQNGSISVDSRPGKGTTFTLTLPRGEVVRVESQQGTARRVLIVEDDESVGEGLRALLSEEGFEVSLIAEGREAESAVASFDPDLVLLDVNLPDISGVDVYDGIRSRWPHLPIIFSTGHADARALSELEKRSVPSIMKPYELSELIALIATVSH